MCDQFAGEIEFLAGLAGWDPRAMETDAFGLNHLAWTRAVRVDGRDVTEELWGLLATTEWTDVSDPYWAPVIRMFPLFGMVANNYVKYYVMHDEMLAAQRELGMTRAEQIMAELPGIMASYRAEAQAEDPDPTMLRANLEHGDFAVSVIQAALSGRDHRLILNVPNGDAIPELPADAIVEVPCTLRGAAPLPQPVGPLPPAVAGLVMQVAHHNRLATDAAVTGDRDLAVRALVAHPLVNSIETAERLVDELLAVHADHLPQFA
jgi:6-phospho-beta-glucosidase